MNDNWQDSEAQMWKHLGSCFHVIVIGIALSLNRSDIAMGYCVGTALGNVVLAVFYGRKASRLLKESRS